MSDLEPSLVQIEIEHGFLGASINYVSRRGRSGVSQMLMLIHNLCNKLAYGGGGGSKIGKILLT